MAKVQYKGYTGRFFLAWCAQEGKTPEKPYTGKFVVRLSPELHRKIITLAQAEGLSLNY